jgi:hypothetical protein
MGVARVKEGPYTGRMFAVCKKCNWLAVLWPENEDPSAREQRDTRKGILKLLDLHCHNCGEGPVDLRMLIKGRGAGHILSGCKECGECFIRPKRGEDPLPYEEQIAIMHELGLSPPLEELTTGDGTPLADKLPEYEAEWEARKAEREARAAREVN